MTVFEEIQRWSGEFRVMSDEIDEMSGEIDGMGDGIDGWSGKIGGIGDGTGVDSVRDANGMADFDVLVSSGTDLGRFDNGEDRRGRFWVGEVEIWSGGVKIWLGEVKI